MTLTKCTLCRSEKLITICQFHDEYIPLCCDCVGMAWPELVARLYRRVLALERTICLNAGHTQDLEIKDDNTRNC